MNIDAFKTPTKEYREIPFWSWNDKLEEDELRWQIGEMDEKGWGGFFIHSRKGLITPYLSEEWMDQVKVCVDEAKKRGLGAWLYDEDKWPSGFCGGKIPRLGREYRQKALLMREDDLELPEQEVKLLSVYAAKKSETGEYYDLKEIVPDSAQKWKADGYNILYFYQWTQPLGPNRFNNTAWVDLLNPTVTDAFLESTHEVYRKAVGSEFGKAIPGIFTDESTILYWAYAPRAALPWSEHFETYFFELCGYKIRDRLPWLFINLTGFEKTRYDFWKTITHYFTQNYVKRIFDWCEKNELKYTGHFMAEDYFEFTMQYIGSLMPSYEYMHIPGVDHLNRNINDVMTVKQVTSVAHQLGKKRVLCEMFGCSGQNFSFEDRKWIVDWAFIHGINLINSHLSLYTMRGERKRDYPPNLFYQQPWWEHNKIMADYCARLSYLLSSGKRVTDILVIHTIESAWCHYNPRDMELSEEGQFDTPETWIEYRPSTMFKTNAFSEDFDCLQNILLKLHHDYDLGDETLLLRHGKAEGASLVVGEASYKVVIVPPCDTLRATTITLLQAFAAAGGTLIFIEDLPRLIDGSPDGGGVLGELGQKALIVPLEHCIIRESLKERQITLTQVEGKGNEDVWVHLRETKDKFIAFFANTNKDEERAVQLKIPALGHLEQWDPFTGIALDIPYTTEEAIAAIPWCFPPSGSLLLVMDKDGQGMKIEANSEIAVQYFKLDTDWQVMPLDKNCMTLDYCTCTMPDSQVSVKMPVHRATALVKKSRVECCLTYSFENEEWDGSDAVLAIENPEDFDISLNGVSINERFDGGYWVDKSFKTVRVGELIKVGSNRVELFPKGKREVLIEAIYLIGNFTVRNYKNMEFMLLQPSIMNTCDNMTQNGYPFFAGRLSFLNKWTMEEKDDTRYVLEIQQEGSITVEAVVNGHHLGVGVVRPFTWDITADLLEGNNDIEIILTTSLHNLLGPHHSSKGEIIACAPSSFSDEKNWTDAYNFVTLGIRSARICKME